MQRRVVCAAMKLNNSIVIGPRHFDETMQRHMDLYDGDDGYKLPWHEADQGFVDQRGVYMTREEAWQVATDAGQIIRNVGGDDGVLYSENLY